MAGACFSKRVFPRDFPAADPISLGWSVISIYLNVAEILPMGGVAGRLRIENSPMGQKYKEEARLQSFSPWSALSDSGVGHGRSQRGRGIADPSTFLHGCLRPPQYGNTSHCGGLPFRLDFLLIVVPIVFA